MSDLDIGGILAELKGFQRDAVDHIMRRLYEDADAGRRFLVADETGLGKSVVARGVIARVIERLEHDDTVGRIDIVYVCSNADLAKQNLQRLNVTGNKHLAVAERLTLIALRSKDLSGINIDGKVVNLISFTPSTSLDMKGSVAGSAKERALLHVMLADKFTLRGPQLRASRMFFQDQLGSLKRFDDWVVRVRHALDGPVDAGILSAFITNATEAGLIAEYFEQLDSLRGKHSIPASQTHAIRKLTSRLRSELARASIDTLEPDLVILDEFQRFRQLLTLTEGNEAAELAHALFDYPAAKVLLLSATPYKPYTAAATDGDEDHYSEFMETLDFLATGSSVSVGNIKRQFAEYRDGVLNGRPVDDIAAELRDTLIKVMSRTERPQVVGGMVLDKTLASPTPDAADFAEYVGLQKLATELEAPITIEYWKSIPQFVNFMETYKVAGVLAKRPGADGDRARALLAGLDSLDAPSLRAYEAIDSHNGNFRAFSNDVLKDDLWRLLWLPPSMPYFPPGGVYAGVPAESTTKRLVFSSWTAAPTAIASLLSYEVDRRTYEGSRVTVNSAETRAAIASRLNWAMDGPRAAAMSTLALFWPHPGLAKTGDPLAAARRESTVSAQDAATRVQASLPFAPEADQAWRAFFGKSSIPKLSEVELVSAFSLSPADETPVANESSGATGLRAHISLAIEASDDSATTHPYLADLAMHSPGNIAYRALGRIRTEHDETTAAGLWRAAVLLAMGLRALFSRLETTVLLDKLFPDAELPYWRAILQYCADGNLQAALDEYVFQLRSEMAGIALSDELLLQLAQSAHDALTLRPAGYRPSNVKNAVDQTRLTARFALRFGGKNEDEEAARLPIIRNAFNSPFWPFVLASTSVGQEGIDFHWWSHAVVHWNIPSNPVDFEQREGRVNRYAGHAVRKNVATAHRADVLACADPNPWKAAFAAAAETNPSLGEFSPFWIYPGNSKILRQTVHYPLSRDIERFRRMKEALTLYRLTLGQPRQEDMMEMMVRRGVLADSVAKLDLSPPRSRGGLANV